MIKPNISCCLCLCLYHDGTLDHDDIRDAEEDLGGDCADCYEAKDLAYTSRTNFIVWRKRISLLRKSYDPKSMIARHSSYIQTIRKRFPR